MAERHKRSNAPIIILILSMFLIGLIIGMASIHFSEVRSLKRQLKDLENATGTTINIEGGEEVIHIHVPKREVKYGSIPVNSYKQENFKDEDGIMAYYDDEGNKISHFGIDISYHQQNINWEELKSSNVEFIMLRCGYRGYTEGGLVKDEKFDEYAKAAVDAGFPIGVYFFTQALTEEEAIEEADFVLEAIESYPISYPVVLDTEYVSDSKARTNQVEMTPQERSSIAIAFCERIKENGYYPMVYASENWLRRSLDADMLQAYEIWAPQYLDTNDFMYDFTIWQYSDAGTVPGIKEQVDLNISLVDYASFVPKMREAFTGGGKIIEESEE